MVDESVIEKAERRYWKDSQQQQDGSQIKEVDLVVQAEQVDYDFCWVWDSRILRSNVWALLPFVADTTSRISVGTGVAVVSSLEHATANNASSPRAAVKSATKVVT